MPANAITLSIDSDFGEVQLTGITARAVTRHLGLSENAADEVEIAVVEGVNNAIEHAYQNTPGSLVHILIHPENDYVVIQVRDHGLTMSDFTIPELEFDPDDPDTLPDGGMGLFIINQVMDSVEYKTENGCNSLIMHKKISD